MFLRIFFPVLFLLLISFESSAVLGNPPPYAGRQEAAYPPPPQPEAGAGRPQGGLIDVDVHDTGYGGKHVGVHVP